ncbi:MAG: 50S ribosomal protein L23 [Acidiferrobacterales bacterium]|nr:50S ribosomal protein L23 [Acidiferrobacterales bacterium]
MSERLYEIIRSPIVSEKSSMVADRYNQLMFEVARDATKTEVRRAVEKLFNVRVQGVQISNSKGKKKRFGRSFGKQSDRRKAFVRLHPDDDIDFTQTLDS